MRKLGSLMVAIAVLAALPASSSAADGFKTGRYTGTTSQKKPVTFVLKHIDGCSAQTESRLSYCLESGRQTYVTLKCPDGTTTNNYLDVTGSLNQAGVLSYTSHGTGEQTDRVDLKVSRGGTVTGYAEFTQAESIEGTGPVCSSGKIRVNAKHT